MLNKDVGQAGQHVPLKGGYGPDFSGIEAEA